MAHNPRITELKTDRDLDILGHFVISSNLSSCRSVLQFCSSETDFSLCSIIYVRILTQLMMKTVKSQPASDDEYTELSQHCCKTTSSLESHKNLIMPTDHADHV